MSSLIKLLLVPSVEMLCFEAPMSMLLGLYPLQNVSFLLNFSIGFRKRAICLAIYCVCKREVTEAYLELSPKSSVLLSLKNHCPSHVKKGNNYAPQFWLHCTYLPIFSIEAAAPNSRCQILCWIQTVWRSPQREENICLFTSNKVPSCRTGFLKSAPAILLEKPCVWPSSLTFLFLHSILPTCPCSSTLNCWWPELSVCSINGMVQASLPALLPLLVGGTSLQQSLPALGLPCWW